MDIIHTDNKFVPIPLIDIFQSICDSCVYAAQLSEMLLPKLLPLLAGYFALSEAGRPRMKGPALQMRPRQLPAEPTGVKTIISPSGVNITYKMPGICETTPGVNSYSGTDQKLPVVNHE